MFRDEKLLYFPMNPMIPCRELWRDEKKNDPQYDPSKPVTRSLFPNRVDTMVYTEKGSGFTTLRLDKSGLPGRNEAEPGIQRDLAFQGFEDSRNTLKYRCPATAYGPNCEGKLNAICCE